MASLAPAYLPRKPLETVLHQLVRQNLEAFLAHARDAPQRGTRSEPAFSEAEDQSADEDEAEAGKGPRIERSGKEQDEARSGAGYESGENGAAGSHQVCHAASLGTAQDGGDVLGGDGESRDDGIKVQLEVDDARKDRHGKADGEITEESLQRSGENPACDGGRRRIGGCPGSSHLL